jgi:hypothetical protein
MPQQEKNQEMQGVRFGEGNSIATTGILSGVAIAVGGPWVLLAFGQSLGIYVLTGLIILCVLCGGALSVVAAFFGLVIPRHVHGGLADTKGWMDIAREARSWEREDRRRKRHEE